MSYKEQPYFVYETLQSVQPSLRLCRVLPGQIAEPFRCELVHRSLSDATDSYAALSYTWGERTEDRWIKVNGLSYLVWPNLYAALHAIRPTEGELWLWIDALCINQKDVQERNDQVALMGNIYRNASEVRVWLGPASEDSDLFFDKIISQPTNLGIKSAAIRLCKRPYWQRAWIRQELLLAKDIILHCGTRSAPINHFADSSLPYLSAEEVGISTLSLLVRNGSEHYTRESMQTLLSRYCETAERYDIRDRIFSVLSLASEFEGRESEIADYTLDVPHLFLGLVAFCKPDAPATFASYLQDTLQARFRDLLPIWNELVIEAQNVDLAGTELSPVKRATLDFIKRVWTLYELPLEERISPDMMYLSLAHFSLPKLFYQDEVIPSARVNALWVYVVQNSDFALRFVPSIFGPILEDFAQKGDDGVWKGFDPPPLPEEDDTPTRESLLFPMRRVLQLGLPKEMVILQKNDIAQYCPSEILDPDIGTAVRIVAELYREQKALCLPDCRSLLEHYCGYQLHGPFDNDGTSKGAPERPLDAQPAQEYEVMLREAYNVAKKYTSPYWRKLIREKEALAKLFQHEEPHAPM